MQKQHTRRCRELPSGFGKCSIGNDHCEIGLFKDLSCNNFMYGCTTNWLRIEFALNNDFNTLLLSKSINALVAGCSSLACIPSVLRQYFGNKLLIFNRGNILRILRHNDGNGSSYLINESYCFTVVP